MANILKWLGWDRDEPIEFDPSRRLFLRKGALAIAAPIMVPPAIAYFLPPVVAAPNIGRSLLAPVVYGAVRGELDYFTIDWSKRPVDSLTAKIRAKETVSPLQQSGRAGWPGRSD